MNNIESDNSGVVGAGGGAQNLADGPSSGGADDAFTRIMGRTPGLIKSKFLSVLDSSNGILSGISSKLEGLSLNSSTTTADDENIYRPQKVPIGKRSASIGRTTDTDTEAEDILIEIESRKLKERRAHEELKSGRFRHPNILTKITNGFTLTDLQNRTTPASMVSPSSTTDSSRSTTNDCSRATTTNANRQHNKSGHPNNKWDNGEDEAAASPTPLKIDITAPSDDTLDGGADGGATAAGQQKNISCAISTVSTSEYDLCIPSSISCETTTTGGVWVRSESVNSVPSWASTISLDSQTDETVIEFVRRFLGTLFDNPDKITLELKSEFGQVVRTEAGRLWFSRLVNAQRAKSKRVDEATFYSLVQYFAIVLFECHDCDDFSPAKSLMNMCFTFYHEICVPGIEPYREYLYLYLRDQPIWHSLRFWNAAFFDALQCERANKPIPKALNKSTRKASSSAGATVPTTAAAEDAEESEDAEEEVDLSVTSGGLSEGDEREEEEVELQRFKREIDDDQRFQQNITFGQLGTFTCNMHAFGLSRDLCLEFLRKQCTIANLGAEHEKLLKDNILRMYRETDKWRM